MDTMKDDALLLFRKNHNLMITVLTLPEKKTQQNKTKGPLNRVKKNLPVNLPEVVTFGLVGREKFYTNKLDAPLPVSFKFH